MILVDSSVWIDYFNGAVMPETDEPDRLLGQELLVIGDLILIEGFQGSGMTALVINVDVVAIIDARKPQCAKANPWRCRLIERLLNVAAQLESRSD